MQFSFQKNPQRRTQIRWDWNNIILWWYKRVYLWCFDDKDKKIVKMRTNITKLHWFRWRIKTVHEKIIITAAIVQLKVQHYLILYSLNAMLLYLISYLCAYDNYNRWHKTVKRPREEEWSGPILVLSLPLPLLGTPMSSPPLCVRAAPFPSPYLSFPCAFLASSVACSVRSGSWRWHTAPDISMIRRCSCPCGTRIALSCTSTWAHICNRPQQPDDPIVLEPWCEPPAPSPPPSSFSAYRYLLIGLLVSFGHLCLWLHLLLEVLSQTSRLSSALYSYARTN